MKLKFYVQIIYFMSSNSSKNQSNTLKDDVEKTHYIHTQIALRIILASFQRHFSVMTSRPGTCPSQFLEILSSCPDTLQMALYPLLVNTGIPALFKSRCNGSYPVAEFIWGPEMVTSHFSFKARKNGKIHRGKVGVRGVLQSFEPEEVNCHQGIS